MQTLIAALAIGLAVLILWRSCWAVMARHSPVMAMRARAGHREAPAEPAVSSPTPWFAPPSDNVLDLKAARVRTEPAAVPPPSPQIGRRGWTAEDDAELLRLLAEEMPAEAIAARLGRSEKSVLLRIPLLRLRQRQAGQAQSESEAA
jgi:hypothetical protein